MWVNRDRHSLCNLSINICCVVLKPGIIDCISGYQQNRKKLLCIFVPFPPNLKGTATPDEGENEWILPINHSNKEETFVQP